ncbi:amidase [Thioflexithrix psekupsensis]|uniref:Amidase domain-containing protein n=1 Tax=Thioflexithrix psekupsensis TaxID=1570016 RepID=A0A251XCB8_9GAMM|nr:amidase [Thioflexithrix psekupsensis]OUD15555.1 hypothetical protein TPSD3_03270 [Thioflexithrix psekupsensis]
MPLFANLTHLISRIHQGQLSVETLLTQYLTTISERENDIHAFVDLQPDFALQIARQLDQKPLIQRQKPLYGIPVAIKEIIDVAGLCCAWGSPIHQGRVPMSDAPLVTRLRDAGAIIIGTTVSTEYAIANAGPTRHPYDLQRTPGGSSSGSAAAVAAQMVPIAIGSQTIGSVIRPATYCGVYGLKPTRGAISRVGVMPLSPALDHIGILASQPEAITLACQALFGFDPRDSGSCDIAPPRLENTQLPKKAIYFNNLLADRIESPSQLALQRATRIFQEHDIPVIEKELPAAFASHIDCIHTLLCRDMAMIHGEDRRRAGQQMSERLRGLIDRGLQISDEAYRAAQQQADDYQDYLCHLLQDDQIFLAAAADSIAPMWASDHTGVPFLQGLWTLTGLPTLAVPCGRVTGLPVGVQLIAKPCAEHVILNAARLIANHL